MGWIKCPTCPETLQSLGFMRHRTMHAENYGRRFVLHGAMTIHNGDGSISKLVEGEKFTFDGRYYHAENDGMVIHKNLFSKRGVKNFAWLEELKQTEE